MAGTAHLIAISSNTTNDLAGGAVHTLHLVRPWTPIVRIHLDAPMNAELAAHLAELRPGARVRFAGLGHGNDKRVEVYPADRIDGLPPG